MSDAYVAWWPNDRPDLKLHLRREGAGYVLVGAQEGDGPIHFMTEDEGPRHTRAIWACFFRNLPGIRAAWEARAAASIANLETERRLTNAERVAIYDAAAENAKRQIETYRADVMQIVAEREASIGEADPGFVEAMSARLPGHPADRRERAAA